MADKCLMRTLTIAVVAGAVTLALATLSVVNMLCQLDGLIRTDTVDVLTLCRGHVHELYLMPLIWQSIPEAIVTLPIHLSILVDPWALVAMGTITAIVWSFWRRRGLRNQTAAGLLILLGTAVPWAIGIIGVSRITSPDQCGAWLSLMIASLFWGAIGCAAFAIADLVRRRSGDDAAPAEDAPAVLV